jgi:hypothetical protein
MEHSGWGDWLVPKLSLSAQAQLEASKRIALNEAKQSPDALAKLCVSLLEQNALLTAITRQATAHIAELEMKEVLQR